MRPAFAVLGPQLGLLGRQILPVMQRVWLLDDADIRYRLALALTFLNFADFSQTAAKIIHAVAQVEFCFDVDDVSRAKIRNAASIALQLNFAEAGLTGARGFSGWERAAGFGANIRRLLIRHIE